MLCHLVINTQHQEVKALQFHASVRLRLKGVGKIKEKVNGVDTVVGQEVECVVVKNRLGPLTEKYVIVYFMIQD